MSDLPFDVVVVGGGAAGVAAAVSAANGGARVALVERTGEFGGMATGARVGTICGLYYRSLDKPQFAVGPFTRDFAHTIADRCGSEPRATDDGLWYLPYQPFEFQLLCDELVRNSGTTSYLHATTFSVELSGSVGGRLRAHAWDRTIELAFKTLVDATGEASACRAAGVPLRDEDARQAGAFVFSLAGVPDVDEALLQRMIQREVAEGIHAGRIPESLSRISLVPGSSQNGGADLKLGLEPCSDDSPTRRSEEESTARRLTQTLVQYLRGRSDFAKIALRSTASMVGVRTGHSPIGDYALTESDVLEARTQADGVAAGSWSIEFWSERRQPLLRHMPLNRAYDIPARALFNSKYPNMFFAGRNISATSWALASGRVIGTCLETGVAAGALAAGVAAGRSIDSIVSNLRASRSDETPTEEPKRVGGLDG